MKNVLEQTDKFMVIEHETDSLYELIDKTDSHRIGIFFTNDDALKFKALLSPPLKPTETLNKRLRKIYQTARRNIDRGKPKL